MQIPFSEFIRKKSILCTKQFMIFYTELRCECLCHPKFYSEVLTQTIIFQKQNQLLNSTECRLQLLLSQGGGGQRSQAVFIPLQESAT